MKRTLIIGIEKKSKNYNSVSWIRLKSKVPTFGDYDDVILVLPTLTTGVLSLIPVSEIKSKIHTAILADTTFFVITAPRFIINGTTSNYSFFNFSFTFHNEDGEMFKEKPEDEYFKKVKHWDYCFSFDPSGEEKTLGWYCKPFAVTKHGRNVAFSMAIVNFEKYGNPAITNSIFFIPPQDKTDPVTNVENFLANMAPEENEEVPQFVKELEAPGEKKLQDALAKNKHTSIIIEAENSKILKELKEIEVRKSILSSKGIQLVNAVVKVFHDLGITLEGEEKFEEDKTLIYDGNKIPVEIKGHDKGATEEDLRQAFAHKNKAVTKPGIKPKAILIVNSFAQTPLENRGIEFGESIVKKENGWDVALLGTRVLYKYWEAFKKTDQTDLPKIILENTGLITYHE